MSDLGAHARGIARSAASWLQARRYALRPGRIADGVGAGLRFDPGVAEHGYLRGDAELPVQEALADHLGPGDVFYDVGANVGFFTVLAARLVGPNGLVVAFEPVPATADLTRRNSELNGFTNVRVLERAASDVNGSGELVLARHIGGAALSTVPRPADATSAITVVLTTIDALLAESGIAAPTVVKIDVEGAETAVLDGMTETMARHRPTIICEIDDGDEQEYESKRRGCVEHLEAAGYRVTQLPDAYPESSWIVGHLLATPHRTDS
jgi:FkbM family methyltransferase